MERPQTILITLLALGLAAAGFFYLAHKTTALEKAHAVEIDQLQRKLSAQGGRNEGDGPTTADLLPETDASTSEEHLQDQVTFLEEQLGLLRDENARLLTMVDRLEAKLNSFSNTGESRVFNAQEEKEFAKVKNLTTKSRELPFKEEVEIEFKNPEEMEKVVEDSIKPKRSDEEKANLSRAYAAMGFVAPATDVSAEIAKLLTSQLGAAFYAGDNKIAFNQDDNLLSVYDRTALAIALDHALQDQNFDLTKAPPPTKINDDSYAAVDALLIGDSSFVKLRHMLYDTASPTDDLKTNPTALTQEVFNAAPPFIREYFLFPYTAGLDFCKALHGQGKWKAINSAIQSPPISTSEVMHPELYFAEKRTTPEAYDWPAEKLKINGTDPLWNNVAGELGISIYLNRGYYKYTMANQGFFETDLPPLSKRDYRDNAGSVAAKGWLGDRYLVYPNGEGAGGSDHVFWRSKWASASDAAEFFHGARVALAQAQNLKVSRADYELASNPEEREPITPETTGTEFEKTTSKGRQIRMTLNTETNEVTIINAGGKEWFEALEAL